MLCVSGQRNLVRLSTSAYRGELPGTRRQARLWTMRSNDGRDMAPGRGTNRTRGRGVGGHGTVPDGSSRRRGASRSSWQPAFSHGLTLEARAQRV